MRLIVDDVVGLVAPGRGIERVLSSLLRNFRDRADLDVSVTILSRTGIWDDYGDEIIYVPKNMGIYSEEEEYISNICRGYKDSVFCSSYYSPQSAIPTVSIVHDLIPEYLGVESIGQEWKNRLRSFQEADSLITVSSQTKQRLDHYYPQYNHKTVPSRIASGFDAFDAHSSFSGSFSETHGIPSSYCLLVGDRRTYKNGDHVVRLARKGLIPITLVVVGGELIHPSIEERERNQTKTIIQVFPNDQELKTLYQNADATLVPSSVEGFGLPARESVLESTPVIARAGVVDEATFKTFIEVGKFSKKSVNAALKKAPYAKSLLRQRSLEFARRDKAEADAFPIDFKKAMKLASLEFQKRG